MSAGNGECRKCGEQVQVCGSPWCEGCDYPGIEDDWQEMRELIAEGHTYAQAAVLSGYKGAEEI